jgi:hypothetical protein
LVVHKFNKSLCNKKILNLGKYLTKRACIFTKKETMKLSRSKIDLFVECPRCFYLDIKMNIKRPPGFPFSLNNAVDHLLKKEFDFHRAKGTQHPIQSGIDAIPAQHPLIDQWRNSLGGGVSYYDAAHDCTLYGGIDDLWVSSEGIYHVVDYKATAKDVAVSELPDWANGYRRQMEIYQWLLRKNGLNVSNTAYFVYCTGDKKWSDFNNTLHFETHLIPYLGDDSWVDETISRLFELLSKETIPEHNPNCSYCNFAKKQLN